MVAWESLRELLGCLEMVSNRRTQIGRDDFLLSVQARPHRLVEREHGLVDARCDRVTLALWLVLEAAVLWRPACRFRPIDGFDGQRSAATGLGPRRDRMVIAREPVAVAMCA